MTTLGTSAAIFAMLMLMIVLSLTTVLLRLSRRNIEQRRVSKPQNLVEPNWSTIRCYTDLADKTQNWRAPSNEAFLDGPFQRYLELASTPHQSPRASARVMEFCRNSLNDFAIESSESTENSDTLQAQARERAAAWFATRPHGDYMLEVLDGVSNHNFRGSLE